MEQLIKAINARRKRFLRGPSLMLDFLGANSPPLDQALLQSLLKSVSFTLFEAPSIAFLLALFPSLPTDISAALLTSNVTVGDDDSGRLNALARIVQATRSGECRTD
jgi:hypothetical protein